jgi:hypothetical protein
MADVYFFAGTETMTLVPSGINTIFTLKGTYDPSVPITTFSSPGAPYTLTFTLPTTPDPSSFAFEDDADGIFGLDATVKVNNISFPGSRIEFFDPDQLGGLALCLSEICMPAFPPSPNSWDFIGDALFTGNASGPVFISGKAAIDPSQSIYAIAPVPEPTSLLLLGTGLVGFATSTRHKLSRRRSRSNSPPTPSVPA